MKTRAFATTRRTLAVLLLALPAWVAGCASSPKAAAPQASGASTTPAGSYAFWPPAPDEPHMQFVKSYRSLDDVSQRQVTGLEKAVFGAEVENADTISKPYGVAIRDGKIYVCDIRNRSLTILDLKKKQTRLVGVSGNTRLRHPVAVALGDDGSIYVADNEQSAILVFDPSERFSRAIGHEKFKPAGVAVHGDRLYATDTASQLVEIFDTRDGRRIGVIGSVGDEDGQFRLPLGVATDAKGDVYVSDMMRCRVQKFGPDGKLIGGFGTQGDYVGAFVRPKHLTVDSEGNVYVVDAGFQNVQVFNPQGKVLMFFGSAGGHPGSMNLPAGIAVADADPATVELLQGLIHPGFKPKHLVVVSNQFGNNRIALYAMGGVREGYAAKDLAKSAVAVSTGVTVPSADMLKFQNPGTVEPPPDAPPGGAPAPNQPAPASPSASPQTPPGSQPK